MNKQQQNYWIKTSTLTQTKKQNIFNNHLFILIIKHLIYFSIAIGLCFLKIKIGIYGGSINLVMIPIILYALEFGWWQGLCFGAIVGFSKFVCSNGFAIDFYSLLIDYVLAYAVVGLVGFAKNKNYYFTLFMIVVAIIARYLMHIISGVTIYAAYAEKTYLNISTPNALFYAVVYNGHYLLMSALFTIIIVMTYLGIKDQVVNKK